MAEYELVVPNRAGKQIEKLPRAVKDKVIDKILSLGGSPRPFGAKKLSATEDKYRIRVGDYRVLYEIDDKIRRVIILDCLHRKESYK